MNLLSSCFKMLSILLISLCFQSCQNQNSKESNSAEAELSESQKREISHALAGLEIHENLELKLFAFEPMLINPTNMDVDAKGRVWITEAFNYRSALNQNNKVNADGDRIVILEDTDGDGSADKQIVFYQGEEVNAALGIAVLDSEVIVSSSPNVWVFTDTNGDDVADKKELLFTGISGKDHDHAVHAFVFGPDGKLYFNFGNAGQQIKDKNGKTIIDINGNEVNHSGNPYRQGMIFRCNKDGSEFEVLAHNFRNNYEVAVDAYGRLWQSDNDDDGNKGVRINYILKYGNYGYTDAMTGAGWSTRRTNMENEIPLRHWHLNDPGVVPNLLQTGAGSPCGIMVYEGDLLPEKFKGQLMHADAGPNVVRSYLISNENSGYKAEIENLVKGVKDNWFRPVDVTTAPDGSVFIADFYDPGVGGHQMGDQSLGRIYRLAPKNHAYKVVVPDFSTIEGSIIGLHNANIATRYLAFNSLEKFGNVAIPALEKMIAEKEPIYAARATWLASVIQPQNTEKYIKTAVGRNEENMRIAAINIALSRKYDHLDHLLMELSKDSSPQVRKEVAIALRYLPNIDTATKIWNELSKSYKTGDRWMLEALGIAADVRADAFFKAWISQENLNTKSRESKDLIWRSKSSLVLPYFTEILKSNDIKLADKLRFFRALDFHKQKAVDEVLFSLIGENEKMDPEMQLLIINHISVQGLKNKKVAAILTQNIQNVRDTTLYLEWIEKFDLKDQYGNLENMFTSNPKSDISRKAAQIVFSKKGSTYFEKLIYANDKKNAEIVLEALRYINGEAPFALKEKIMRDQKMDLPIRNIAMDLMGTGWNEEDHVLKMLMENKIPTEMVPAAVSSLSHAYKGSVRKMAMTMLPANENSTKKSMAELIEMSGNAEKGVIVYERLCQNCHALKGKGIDFGPGLSEIGDKLSKEGLYSAIFYPSAGISFGYEGYIVKKKDGSSDVGIITSKTADAIELKNAGGTTSQILNADISSIEKMENSLMLEGLSNSMSENELIDLVAFLQSLKKVES